MAMHIHGSITILWSNDAIIIMLLNDIALYNKRLLCARVHVI